MFHCAGAPVKVTMLTFAHYLTQPLLAWQTLWSLLDTTETEDWATAWEGDIEINCNLLLL